MKPITIDIPIHHTIILNVAYPYHNRANLVSISKKKFHKDMFSFNMAEFKILRNKRTLPMKIMFLNLKA